MAEPYISAQGFVRLDEAEKAMQDLPMDPECLRAHLNRLGLTLADMDSAIDELSTRVSAVTRDAEPRMGTLDKESVVRQAVPPLTTEVRDLADRASALVSRVQHLSGRIDL